MERKKLAYSVVAVLVVVVVGVAVYLNSTGASSLVAFDNVAVPQSQLATMRSITDNMTLANKVGIGVATGVLLPVTNVSRLTVNGTPEVLYMGADYCPFCAATRWGLVLALMRFGNFTSLHYMTSSASDYAPSTPTFTFYNSSYSSNIIDFVEVEMSTNYIPSGSSSYATLQTPTPFEGSLFTKYDLDNQLIPQGQRGGIPFIDFGNVSVAYGAAIDPKTFDNKQWNDIISLLNDPGSQQAQAAIGAANLYTAQICAMTNGTPASVCSQPFIGAVKRYG